MSSDVISTISIFCRSLISFKVSSNSVNMCQLRGVKPLKQCREVILTAVILMITLASNRSTPQSKENGLTDLISLTSNMPTGLYLSILKLFITPLGSIATATICLLATLKNYMRGYVLCRQLSWQNFSFYFVLNLDTGPISPINKSPFFSLFSLSI